MTQGDERFVRDEQFLRDLYNLKYLFGDKWAPAINVTLSHGPMRRAEILSTITSYSLGEEWSGKPAVLHDSILTRTLRKMTKEGLLVRTRDTSTFPPKVFYSLVPEVSEFIRLVEPLVGWVRRNPGLIARAQAYNGHHGEDDDVVALLGIGGVGTDTSELDDDEDTVDGQPGGTRGRGVV